jgi:DNA adenine methylase
LRWAGGKARILDDLESSLPNRFDILTTRYVEPFLGGGATMFYFLSNYNFKEIILSDLNKDLINFYCNLRDIPHELVKQFNRMVNIFNNSIDKEMYYYNIRKIFNENICGGDKTRLTVENAAIFLFINKTSYNGIFRVNGKGLYNVPFGKKKVMQTVNQDVFVKISKKLEKAKITHADFMLTLNSIVKDEKTFIYLDPPYVTGHQNNGFVSYNESLFPWEHQVKMVNAIKGYTEQGVRCMISNADSEAVRKLYSDDVFVMNLLDRKCCIAGQKESRGSYSELIVTNYPQNKGDKNGII